MHWKYLCGRNCKNSLNNKNLSNLRWPRFWGGNYKKILHNPSDLKTNIPLTQNIIKVKYYPTIKRKLDKDVNNNILYLPSVSYIRVGDTVTFESIPSPDQVKSINNESKTITLENNYDIAKNTEISFTRSGQILHNYKKYKVHRSEKKYMMKDNISIDIGPNFNKLLTLESSNNSNLPEIDLSNTSQIV